MAVVTFTQRQVVDMLPEFLSKRAIGYRPRGDAFAKELGISWTAVLILGGSFIDDDGDGVARRWYRRRSPYPIKDGRPATWDELIAAGLAERAGDGWKLTARGSQAAAEHQRRVYAYVGSLELPADATARAAGQLERLARRVPPDAERVGRTSRWWGVHPEVHSVARALSDAAQVLWAWRDDCHVGAWQDAGYEGPVFDVLSFMWPGRPDMAWTKLPGATSLDALADAMKARQDRADVERAVAALAERGNVAREGDAVRLTPKGQKTRDEIEDETDRRFFAIWDLDDAATARLGEDLRAVIDALPKAA